MSSRVSNKDVHLGEHRKQKPFLKFNDLQCPTCKKCLYSANHDKCVLEYLSRLNPRASAQNKDAKSHKTTKRYMPVEKSSASKKPERQIPTGHSARMVSQKMKSSAKTLSQQIQSSVSVRAKTFEQRSLVPQGQKALDYDNSDPVPPRQNVVPPAEKTDSSQQGLEFLFSPLLEEYYNPAHGQAEENNNDQAPNASFQEDKFINPFCTRVQEIGEPSSHNINNTDVHSFQPQSHDYRWTKDHPLEQVRGNPNMQFKQDTASTDPEKDMSRSPTKSLGTSRPTIWQKMIIKLKWLWKTKGEDQTLLAWRAVSDFVCQRSTSSLFQSIKMDGKRHFLMSTNMRRFMLLIEGSSIRLSKKVYLLGESLYGLKAAPRAWNYKTHQSPKASKLMSKNKTALQCLQSETDYVALSASCAQMRHSMRMLVKDIRSQDGIDDKDNDKGSKSRSQSMKEQAYNKEQRERPRPHELNDKSNLIDLMKECHQ
ncbi:hypothetical protein Tco_0448362 [Tanacetum coccineum]